MQKVAARTEIFGEACTLSDYPTSSIYGNRQGLPQYLTEGALYMVVMRKTLDLFLVAEFEGKIVGAVVAFKRLKMGYAHHLAVHPKCQRQGIGSKLLEQVCKRLSFGKAPVCLFSRRRESQRTP